VRVLVTGGAGFIGSNYVRHVIGLVGDEAIDGVTIFDSFTYAGREETIRDVLEDPRVRLVRGDICDREGLAGAMAGHDAVAHFAAESHVDRSIVGPDAFVRTNCDGTNVVMDVARQAGVDRVLHVSTDEVYGSIATGSFAETDALGPRSPYSASKAGSDLIALSYVATFGLPVIVTRSSNNYGPFQFPEKVIPLFTTNLLRGRPVPLYGDGGNERDWLHVSDNCAALHLALCKGSPGTVYNVASQQHLTNVELSERLVALCGADRSLIERVPDRLGHDRRYSVTTDRIEALGWSPRWSLDVGLEATVAWYRENEWWWAPLAAA